MISKSPQWRHNESCSDDSIQLLMSICPIWKNINIYHLNKRAFDVLVIKGWRTYTKANVDRKEYLIVEKGIEIASSGGCTQVSVIFRNTFDAVKKKRKICPILERYPIQR